MEDNQWTGFRAQFEVWPYVSQTEFTDVDKLSDLIMLALDRQVIIDPDTNEVFTCQYQGNVAADKADVERDGITRGLRFSVMAARSYEGTVAVEDDTWLVALTNWSSVVLGNEWHVYRERWPLDYIRPSVLWRLENIEASAGNRAAFELKKRIVGHVIGRTLNEQTTKTLELVHRLNSSTKIPLDLPNRRYLTLLNPIADLELDSITEGQISLTLTRKIERPVEESPLMQQINYHSIL
ncbi:hypothetical protein KCTCHS21_08490 [Cohnella abietis]|uniref:Uncharacterized protein n=1 Tax=Cohnella abietis TaxID=2507935 RepID=A0A3T1D025_9BACL|nr:hypothetical protein KCTCHS21_08490 [Cohnella abietis]